VGGETVRKEDENREAKINQGGGKEIIRKGHRCKSIPGRRGVRKKEKFRVVQKTTEMIESI